MLLVLGLLIGAGGPLGLRTQGPLRELFLDMTAADARPIDRPDLDVRYSVANTWNDTMGLVRGPAFAVQALDEQADSLSLRLRAPWPQLRRVWSSLEWKITGHWGGWSDRPIEAWHSLIGAFNYNRSINPRNRVRLLYADSGGQAFDIRSATLAPGDLTARTQVALFDGPVALAARFDLKLPVGSLSAAGGSGGVDAGAGLVATWPALRWLTLHGLFALSRFSHLSAPTALQPKEWHLTADLSLEFDLLGSTLFLEDRVVSPLLEPGWQRIDVGSDDDALLASGLYASFRSHNQVSFGFRRGRFSFWLSEDFTPGSNAHSVIHWLWVSNAPDVVLGVAFTQPL
ncbi:MAG TPA: DUF3187 family protein [Myxococcales bacterium]|nr:DUF3187 family protein [Myxococcales bacterium]